MNTTYETIKANSLPLIESYHNDLLVHDKAAIENENPSIPFLHFTRAWGTHLYFLYPVDRLPGPGEIVPYLFGTADRRKIVEDIAAMVEHHNKPTSEKILLVQWYNGKKIQPVSMAAALAIAANYRSNMIRFFNCQKQEEVYA